MQKRCARNRKRSKRRGIYCPEHGCYLDSVSQKYRLYTESAETLRLRGMSRLSALMLVASKTAVTLEGEWLEGFWCDQCQQTRWYHVSKIGDREYQIQPAPRELWSQASGVTNLDGNPSVGEFTRRQARSRSSLRDFRFIG